MTGVTRCYQFERAKVGLQLSSSWYLQQKQLTINSGNADDASIPSSEGMIIERHSRYFQHAHFIPRVGVGKRGEY